uniref:Uncharacterized protein n=1 Tax=Meleagris gallopavo TaxID=9103 RepID=A0A803YG44_MELGA
MERRWVWPENLPLFFLSLENRVKETLHKAFWDRLKKQISASPPDYTQAIQLLQEIKEALLLLLLPQNSQLRSQIEGVLDLELIRQEAEHGKELEYSKADAFITCSIT